MSDSSQATITNSQISGNELEGIDMDDSSQATITNSQISSNGLDGISMWGSSQAKIRGSIIEDNGTREGCQDSWICNGITVWDRSQTTIIDSVIRNNTGWGVAAVLKKCGSDMDRFEGEVEIIDTEIYGNGRGDVCLP